MAMASNPNHNNSPADGSQSFQGSTRRVDSARGQSSVPVLFRLKNLQRAEPVGGIAEPKVTNREASSDPRRQRSTAEAISNSSRNPSGLPRQEPPLDPSPVPSGSSRLPSPATTPEPVAVSGKGGISNGFILLAVAVVVAFAVGRTSNKAAPVATHSDQDTHVSAASVPTSGSAPTVAPLAPPALPVIATSEPASTLNLDGAALASSADASISKLENQNTTLRTASLSESTNKSSAIQAEKLAVPSMLVVAEKGETETGTVDLDREFIAATASSSHDETPTETKPAISPVEEQSPNQSSNVSAMQAAVQPVANAMPVADEITNYNRSKLVTTSVPDMDTAQLYEMRANYQSQMEALARARQGQNPPAVTMPVSQPPMQYVSSSSMPVGQTLPSNIAPPPPGYGQSQPNMNAPSQPYVSSGRYAPIGGELTYPSNVPANQPTSSQTYQPVFNVPPSGQNPFPNSH